MMAVRVAMGLGAISTMVVGGVGVGAMLWVTAGSFQGEGRVSAGEGSEVSSETQEPSQPERLTVPLADGLDYPVGPPDGTGYYDAQDFGRNTHLGEDWNRIGAGYDDLGDPIHSIGHGHVVAAYDARGGWGWLVRIVHRVSHEGDVMEVESLYAHLDEIHVGEGDVVTRGQPIGTMGDAHGRYVPHLHFELRSEVGKPVGPGYSETTTGYLHPSAFIDAHRPQ